MPCECTTECGDDPNVQARTVLGCADYRARTNPAAVVEQLRADLAATLKERDELRAQVDRLQVVPVVPTLNERLRVQLRALLDLMNRLEPDTPDDVREAAEVEWDERKEAALLVLMDAEVSL